MMIAFDLPSKFRSARALGRRLGESKQGVTAVEFALIAPVFLVMLIGSLDLGHTLYVRSVLSGAVESASRLATLETGSTAAADQIVYNAVAPTVPGVQITSERKSYFDFSDIGRPERWTDSNLNDTCDNGEPYIDENKSGQWEADVGAQGNGGANDVVVYTVTATYKPLFQVPMPYLKGDRTLTVVTVGKNQPYALQASQGTTTGVCP